MHVRQQVAEAVAAVLNAGSPVHWGRVFVSRISPPRDVTPYLMVTAESEEIEPDSIHSGFLQQRDITVIVRGRERVLEGEQMESALADMQAEIETRLTVMALQGQMPGAKTIWLRSVGSDVAIDDDERSYSELTTEWVARVYTVEGQPETAT